MTLKPNKNEPTPRFVRWIYDDVWALALTGKFKRAIKLGAWLSEAIEEKSEREARNKR